MKGAVGVDGEAVEDVAIELVAERRHRAFPLPAAMPYSVVIAWIRDGADRAR